MAGLRSALLGALALATVSIAAASCGTPAAKDVRAGGLDPRHVSSNVRFADYAGSKACARCHWAETEAWTRSAMHNMTRAAPGADVKGPFDGTVFKLRDDTARLERAGADRFVTITSKFGDGVWRVTRVIGGHHREDYAGVRVAAVREGAPALGDPTEERVLPVSYILSTRSVRYKGYSVMVKERDGLKAGAVWNQTCIFCHNTVPYLSTVIGALAHKGGYQGEVVDPLLPAKLRATYEVKDPDALSAALAEEMIRLGASGETPTPERAVSVTRERFRAGHLVEVGIGCESCHLGSIEHVKDPKRLPSFEPASDAIAVKLADRAQVTNRVCVRCHQVLFSGYDPTWEGGSRRRAPGGSHINSGEARDMMLGACTSRLGCTACHDPHAPDATARLRALPAEKEDGLCTGCHDRYRSPDALRAHAHHDPAKAGGRCLGCHMPKKNMSLDGDLTRYHRIGSPTDVEKVLLDRPIECALCHADKSAFSLVTTMEKWWSKAYDRVALEKLYGPLDGNVLLATAERGKPHEQAVAFQLLGETRARAAVPVLAAQLLHPYPLVRGYAKRALDAVVGAPVAVDIDAPDDVIQARVDEFLRSRK